MALKFQEDLQNCFINFNKRILVTDLLEQYQLQYTEVNDVLQQYINEQESTNKTKYEKRFLVNGQQEESNYIKEIYNIVEEQKLSEWLNKLKKSTSMLYSVQIQGGARPPAEIFKPLSINKNAPLRDTLVNKFPKTTENHNKSLNNVKEVKPKQMVEETVPQTKIKLEKEDAVVTPSTSSSKLSEKSPTVKKVSPTTSKGTKTIKTLPKPAVNKKGINTYFSAGTATKKTEETKTVKNRQTSVTPKKMQDFFKNQSEKTTKNETKSPLNTDRKATFNTSIQLFDDDDDDNGDYDKEDKDKEKEKKASDYVEVSSDEEENIEALKRDIISSDVEMEESDKMKSPSMRGIKRRRIVDTDDEDEENEKQQLPPEKIEKLDNSLIAADDPPQPATYLDDDGFVMTIRAKPHQKSSATKTNVTLKTSPPSGKKQSSPNENKKEATASTAAAAAGAKKSKQADLMNYFKKK